MENTTCFCLEALHHRLVRLALRETNRERNHNRGGCECEESRQLGPVLLVSDVIGKRLRALHSWEHGYVGYVSLFFCDYTLLVRCQRVMNGMRFTFVKLNTNTRY